MSSVTIVEFLTARLDEWERPLRDIGSRAWRPA